MTQEDKKEMYKIVVEAINEEMIPVTKKLIQDSEDRMAKKMRIVTAEAIKEEMIPVTKKLIQDSEDRMAKKMRIVTAEAINDVANPAIESLIKDSENKMEKSMDVKLEKQKEEIVHEILDSNDALAKEVKDVRQEQTFGSYDITKLTEKNLDHEKRIVVLEEKTA